MTAVLALALVLLQLLDLASTYVGLAGGATAEANPLGAAYLRAGFAGMVLAKGLATTVFLAGSRWLATRGRQPGTAAAGLTFATAGMAAVVTSNLAHLA